MLALLGGTAGWSLLRLAAGPMAALAAGLSRRARRRPVLANAAAASKTCAAPNQAASAAVLEFSSAAQRYAAGAPRPASTGG